MEQRGALVTSFFRLLRLAAVLLTALPAHAHDQWLEAEPNAPTRGARVKLYLQVGEHLASAEPVLLRSKGRLLRLDLVSQVQRQSLLRDLREDGQPLLTATLPEAGSCAIALDSAPRSIELSADKFAAYLLEERLIDVLTLRAQAQQEDAPGRELYSRNLKLLLLAPGGLDVTAPLGQELEVVPAVNPLQATGTLSLKVLFRGKPLPHRAVTAANRLRSALETQTLRTDAEGNVTFRFQRRGDWFFGLVHMEPAVNTPEIDWRSHWASLAFSLP